MARRSSASACRTRPTGRTRQDRKARFGRALAILAAGGAWLAGGCAAAQDPDFLVFPFAGRAFLVREAGPARALTLPGDIRARDFSITDSGFIAWDRAAGTLVRRALAPDAGAEALIENGADLPLAAAQVFVSERLILSRSTLFVPGKGFSFSLHALEKSRMVPLASFDLDCFPADAVFYGDSVLFIGADEADTAHTLYRADASGRAPLALLSFPKRGDFGRLVAGPRGLLVFASHRDKSVAPPRLWYLPQPASRSPAIVPLALEAPPDLACLYGDGLALGASFWLPFAGSEGAIELLELVLGAKGEADQARFGRRVPDSGGVYLPLAERGGAAWYLAFDYLADPGAYALARFDGKTIRKQTLQAAP